MGSEKSFTYKAQVILGTIAETSSANRQRAELIKGVFGRYGWVEEQPCQSGASVENDERLIYCLYLQLQSQDKIEIPGQLPYDKIVLAVEEDSEY